MPKISGRDLLSETTEKVQASLFVVTSIAVVSKAYRLPVGDMRMLGMELPTAIFDVSVLLLVIWYSYNYFVRWAGDLMAFRLWYSESSIWSQFGTNMKLDKTFISGGIDALKAFNDDQVQQAKISGDFSTLPDDKKRLYENFKLNAELYALRLEYAGKKFSAISTFGHFYVWGQGFVLPAVATMFAFYMLIKYGTFALPLQL